MTDAFTAWTPLELRDVRIPNRVWMSPMCQYSAGPDGVPTAWHLTHYASRAVGGAGMVVVECSGISAPMRTTPSDLGLWSDDQVTGHRALAAAIRAQGAVPAVQLGAAGRKSSHNAPWDNTGSRSPVAPADGGWVPVAPSPIAFAGLTPPEPLTRARADRLLEEAAHAARNADAAGYDVLEFHGANGYLIHTFLSPLTNVRDDEWGGDLEARLRFPLELISAVRQAWPDHKPLMVRMPATDLVEGGYDTSDAEIAARALAAAGVDVLDISSAVLTPDYPRRTDPLYDARYGPLLRASGASVVTSGLVTEPAHLEEAVPDLVDALLVGRALLRDPYWPVRARGGDPRGHWPRQYHRAF
jgi:2,4-dienoyl-CoA reductase-like NADH-dependent reductase (Old Yellow Enzyme family)